MGNVRQERSSLVTSSPGLLNESQKSIDPESEKTFNKNMEESKRDVSLEELLNDNSQNRKKRINKDKKSVEKDTNIKTSPRTHKKSLHSTLGEYIALMVSTGKATVGPALCISRILCLLISYLTRASGIIVLSEYR